MLKKIDTDFLIVGMYVDELCGSWIDTPFWRSSFLVEDDTTLDQIHKAGIKQVVIDTSKGKDVAVLPCVAEAHERFPSSQSDRTATADARPAPVLLNEELERAAKIVDRSRKAVMSLFSEARMGKAIDSAGAVSVVEEIALSVMRNPQALISIARLKTADDYTYMHSVAVCALMLALARQLGLKENEAREAGIAGLLHDIGKVAIPAAILNKPGKLSDDEFMSIKSHPREGYNILKKSHNVSDITLDVCLHHHEKMDGTGYPNRLAGDKISLFAKMGAVCDVYDAVTSIRPYKQGWCPAESIRWMAERSKTHFDPEVFQAFVKSVGIYPVGSLVRLESGRLGVVIEQRKGKPLLLPTVKVFFSSKSMTYIPSERVDLWAPGHRDRIVATEEPAKWGMQNIDRYWMENACQPTAA